MGHFPGQIGGVEKLSRLYTSLLWNIHSYFEVEKFNPESLEIESSTEAGSENLEYLEERLDSFDETWRRLELQRDSTDIVIERWGLFEDDAAIEGMKDENEKILKYLDEERDKIRSRLERLIERQKTKLDVNLSKRNNLLSIAIVFFSLVQILNGLNIPKGHFYGISHQNIVVGLELVLLAGMIYYLDIYQVIKESI
ncbi:MAG: hypothetical protein ABEJ83_01815 [Candidatus Nanohaloarchaea archaeon]